MLTYQIQVFATRTDSFLFFSQQWAFGMTLFLNACFWLFCVHLSTDQNYVLKKCPYLINEMINICASLVAMAMSGRGMCHWDFNTDGTICWSARSVYNKYLAVCILILCAFCLFVFIKVHFWWFVRKDVRTLTQFLYVWSMWMTKKENVESYNLFLCCKWPPSSCWRFCHCVDLLEGSVSVFLTEDTVTWHVVYLVEDSVTLCPSC